MTSGKSNTQRKKERDSVIGALFRNGDREGALALMRGQITIEEAVERLR